MAESTGQNGSGTTFKVNDRVQRVTGKGALGVVTSIRADSLAVSSTREENGILLGVQWDNGSYSFFTPTSLKHHSA